ncbi:MAG: hypothetical protein IJO70_11510 [Lachnospiraceae bacterium]|nr:hypothetical protein [Lachnospiraceae bacterium]
MNEIDLLKSRLKDLANKSYKQNIYTYSAFLTSAELVCLDELRDEMSFVDYETFGGYELAERQLVGFGSERALGYTGDWPIKIIKVEPLIDKFADDLSHRDFLGAIMNLGIERNVFGDILVKDGKRAYIFAMESIADFIMDNLTKIKHTNVKTSIVEPGTDSMEDLKPTLVDMDVIVASPRFDAIIGGATKVSRSEALNLFKAKKVTLNGRLCERNSMTLKDGDIFSIRGYGKFKFCGAGNETRKGRVYVKLKKYV